MEMNQPLTHEQARERAQERPQERPATSPVSRLLELAEKHAQPAHDEEAYYHPPPRKNPWEGIGYFWFALTAGVVGWASSYFWTM